MNREPQTQVRTVRSMSKEVLALLVSALLVVVLAACDRPTETGEAGATSGAIEADAPAADDTVTDVTEATNELDESMNEAADNAGEALDDAGDAVAEGADDAGDAVTDAAAEAGEEIDLAAARAEAHTALAAEQARVEANENLEEVGAAVQDARSNLEEAYQAAGDEAAAEWENLSAEFDALEEQLQAGAAEASDTFNQLLQDLEN